MEKFFELSVVSRKNVTEEPYVTAKARSERGEYLGKAIVTVKKEEERNGIYFKYIPSLVASEKESIATLEIQSKNQQAVKEALKEFKKAILKKARQDSNMDFMTKILFTTYASCCIDEEAGRISIPKDMEINITNEMIAKYVLDDWVGIEVRIPKKTQERIQHLAEEKKKKQEEELRELAKLMKSIAEEDNYLEFLKKYYKKDEDDE